MNVAAIVLAAGLSERFGPRNKLLQEFRGKPLLGHVLEKTLLFPFSERVAVCSPETEPVARAAGFTVIRNPLPGRGQSSSVRLGIGALSSADGAMFFTGDQPFVSPGTVGRLFRAFLDEPERIIGCCGADGRFRVPAVFPSSVFHLLLAQEGDTGGREIVRARPDLVRLISVGPREQFDIDTPADFVRAAEMD